MSCMILTADKIAGIAGAMKIFLEESATFNDHFGAEYAFKAFKDCETEPAVYNDHKIYRRLYIENLRAFNGRYNENVKEFERYKRHDITNNKLLYKAVNMYIYQLEEDATHSGDVIKASIELRNHIANKIARAVTY